MIPGHTHPVRSVIERVEIEETGRLWDQIARDHFTPDEIDALAAKKVQTRAGYLALKKALVSLLSPPGKGPAFEERDFVITNNARGAPELFRSPVDPGGSLFVSISHTRTQAYGLAVLVEESDD
jgi:phosphopantetheinyl transferase (holo-ACP synthase)